MYKKFGLGKPDKKSPPKPPKEIGEIPVVQDEQVPKNLREAMSKKMGEVYGEGDGRKVTDLHPSEEVLAAFRERVAKTAHDLGNKGNGMRMPAHLINNEHKKQTEGGQSQDFNCCLRGQKTYKETDGGLQKTRKKNTEI